MGFLVTSKKAEKLEKGSDNYKHLSTFGRFCIDSKHCVFKDKKGRLLDKWEVYFRGCRDVNEILKGRTVINAKQYSGSIMSPHSTRIP